MFGVGLYKILREWSGNISQSFLKLLQDILSFATLFNF